MAPHFRPHPLLALTTVALVLALSCGTTSPYAAKYPPRPGGCKVRVFHSPAPDVKEWDDLGVAHVDCPLDVGSVQCLRRLQMDACRMGGDILYDVPKKPLRPTEQGMVYTGHVAHTKERVEDAGKGNDDAGRGELDQQEEQRSGPIQPVEPIASPAPNQAKGATVPLVPIAPLSNGRSDTGRSDTGRSDTGRSVDGGP